METGIFSPLLVYTLAIKEKSWNNIKQQHKTHSILEHGTHSNKKEKTNLNYISGHNLKAL